MRTAQATATLAVAASCVVLATATGADAHAVLVASSPTDGAVSAQEPSSVSLTFSGVVRGPAYVTVSAPDGTPANRGRATVLDHRVVQATRSLGIAGRYAMSYRVVSADGHPVEGTVHFTVRDGRTVSPVATHEAGSFVRRHVAALMWAVGGLLLAGLVLLRPRRQVDARP